MINFTGKLAVDKSFYTKVKSSDKERLIQCARAIVEGTDLFDRGDVYLKAKNVGKRVNISIDYLNNKDLTLVESDREIHGRPIFQQLLMIGCVLNNIKALDYGNLDCLIEAYKNHSNKSN